MKEVGHGRAKKLSKTWSPVADFTGNAEHRMDHGVVPNLTQEGWCFMFPTQSLAARGDGW